MAGRDLSVVVFGATGVTGRLVAGHLSRCAAEDGFAWAAAGRDPDKIERVLGELGASAPERIAADLGDAAALREMAARTRVVLNLVGPYTLHGEPVIEACIEAGAHYADLTGEMPFVRRMIDRHGDAAASAGIKVINTCGFEALPFDLAVLLAAETARERWGEDLSGADVNADLPTPKGISGADIVSGGTVQSSAESLDDPEAARLVDPAVLIDAPELAERIRSVSPIAIAPRIGADGEVYSPMMPSPYINPAVIHRTAVLVAAEERRESGPFRYREGVRLPGGPALLPLRYAAGAAAAGLQAGIRALAGASPDARRRVAAVIRRRLPSSGFGPSGPGMENWRWGLVVNATTTGGHHVRVELDAEGHPGYLATGRMLAEAGLLLAEDGATPERHGFLTPAAALGTGALERFQRAGVRLRVAS